MRLHFDPPASLHPGAWSRKPRHLWLRIALGLLGLGVLLLLVLFSVFIGAAMLTVGLLYRLWKQRATTISGSNRGQVAKTGPVSGDKGVLEGSFSTVRQTRVLPSP